jgi:hypothetical protein
MRLIIHPRPPDMGRWGVLEKLLFDGVLVEAGDGAQPPGDGGAGAAACFQVPAKPSMSARRTANRCRERARHQVVNWRRSSAYASRVSPRYPARKPASASRSASLNAGCRGTRALVVAVIGYLPVGLRPMRLGQPRPQQPLLTTMKPPCPLSVTRCHSPRITVPTGCTGKRLQIDALMFVKGSDDVFLISFLGF